MKGTSASPASKKAQLIRKEHRTLLASEVVLLLSVVPSFYKSMDSDSGIQGILQAAIDNDDLTRKILSISRNIRAQGGDINTLYEEITVHIVHQIEQTSMNTRRSLLQHTLFTTLHNSTHTNEAESEWKLILGTKNAYPKRPKSAILTSGEHLTLGKRSTVPEIHRTDRAFSAGMSLQASKVQGSNRLGLGSKILLGPQNLARVIAMPEANIALVQMSSIPAPNGSVIIHTNNSDDHYCYVDVTKLELDSKMGCFKPRGTVGDRVTLQAGYHEGKRPSLSNPPDALLSERDDIGKENRKSTRSLKSGLNNTPRSSLGKPGLSPRSVKNNKTFILSSDEEGSEDEVGGEDEVMSKGVQLPPRPLSAVFKEKMDLRLPSQFSDTWTDSGSQARNLETPSVTPVPPQDGDELVSENTERIANLGLPLAEDDDPNDKIIQAKVLMTHADQGFQCDATNNNLPDNTEFKVQMSHTTGLHLELVQPQIVNDLPIKEPHGSPQDATPDQIQDRQVNINLQEVEAFADENEPELQALSGPPQSVASRAKNRMYKRSYSARQPKQARVLSSKSRPMSALPEHKSRRKYRDDVGFERPDSASSFQLERTEAWRSSASSSTHHLNFEANPVSTLPGFITGQQNRQKITFQISSLRPTPPQRPSSPFHTTTDTKQPVEEAKIKATPPAPKNIKEKGGIKLASKWLADGKDLYEEYKASRIYMSPRLPGYLDGSSAALHIPKKNVPSSLPLTNSLAINPEMQPKIHSCKKTTPTTNHLRAYLPPGIGVPLSITKSKFSSLSEIKQLYGRYTSVTAIKPQKK